MENKTRTAILITIVIIAVAIGVGSYLVKGKKAIPKSDPIQATTQTKVEEPVQAPAEEKPVKTIEEVTALPANELISMEEAAKTGTEINLKIKAGIITKEEGEKQLQILRSHIAPPTQAATK